MGGLIGINSGVAFGITRLIIILTLIDKEEAWLELRNLILTRLCLCGSRRLGADADAADHAEDIDSARGSHRSDAHVCQRQRGRHHPEERAGRAGKGA